MLTVSAFADEKNLVEGKAFILLFELEYDTGSYVRYARWPDDVSFGGETWTSFPIADFESSVNTKGEIPAFDITFSNVGREIQAILEFYEIEGREGRVLWVHPDHLGDATAKIEEQFTVVSAVANAYNATLTLSPVTFDPLGILLPREVVTTSKFPGIIGRRSRFLV